MANLRRELEADLDAFEDDESWPEAQEAVTDILDQDQPTVVVPAPLPDRRAAEGVMRRIKRLQAEADEITDLAQGQIDRLVRWRDDRLRGVQRDIAFGEQALDAFTRRTLAGKKKRSVELPDGTLQLRDQSDRCVVTDLPAFLMFAVVDGFLTEGTGDLSPEDEAEQRRAAADTQVEIVLNEVLAHPELVRVTIEPALDEIKKTADRGEAFRTPEGEIAKLVSLPGGELIPGIEIRRGEHPTFKAKPNAQ